MKNTTVLQLSFALIVCICILVLINSRTSIFGTIGTQYSPSPTPSDVESITQNTDRIVAQFNSYDNITKQLKMSLYYISKTDCSRITGPCIELEVNKDTVEIKTIILTNDVTFKMLTLEEDECVIQKNLKTKRTTTIDGLLNSKCKYIGSDLYFEVKFDGDQIIEFNEISFYIPGYS